MSLQWFEVLGNSRLPNWWCIQKLIWPLTQNYHSLWKWHSLALHKTWLSFTGFIRKVNLVQCADILELKTARSLMSCLHDCLRTDYCIQILYKRRNGSCVLMSNEHSLANNEFCGLTNYEYWSKEDWIPVGWSCCNPSWL